jgi:hypothetical protein
MALCPVRVLESLKHVHRKRGRPPKFGRPSQIVALTLPRAVVQGLRKIHQDPAWAIVSLVEKRALANGNPQAEAELVNIGDRESLIVINRAVFKRLPGVDIVPFSADRAFLALEPGCGIADLDTAVSERLDNGAADPAERRALGRLRASLRGWRRNRNLRFHTRVILVVERSRSVSASTPRRAVPAERLSKRVSR